MWHGYTRKGAAAEDPPVESTNYLYLLLYNEQMNAAGHGMNFNSGFHFQFIEILIQMACFLHIHMWVWL